MVISHKSMRKSDIYCAESVLILSEPQLSGTFDTLNLYLPGNLEIISCGKRHRIYGGGFNMVRQGDFLESIFNSQAEIFGPGKSYFSMDHLGGFITGINKAG